jgi:hypothetical protein
MIGLFTVLPCQDYKLYYDWLLLLIGQPIVLLFLLNHNTIIRGSRAASHKIQSI